MNKLLLKSISWLLLAGLLPITLIFLWPRTYLVPEFQHREETEYWQMPDGSRIGYTHLAAQGPQKPYPLIYLHGGPGGIISDQQIELLQPLTANGFDIYLYDQLGSGHSSRLAAISDYTVARHQQDLAAIVSTIGAEKVFLLGQSWGALLATQFIAEHAEQVAGVIFTGPGPVLPIRRELASMPAPDSLELRAPIFSNQQANQAAGNPRTKLIAEFALRFGCKLASDAEADHFATYQNGLLNRSVVCDTSRVPAPLAGVGYYVQLMTVRSFRHVPDHRRQIQASGVPALILKGQCDNQPWGYTQEYFELFPDHQFRLILNAGHSIGVEQPLAYQMAIRDFLLTH